MKAFCHISCLKNKTCFESHLHTVLFIFYFLINLEMKNDWWLPCTRTPVPSDFVNAPESGIYKHRGIVTQGRNLWVCIKRRKRLLRKVFVLPVFPSVDLRVYLWITAVCLCVSWELEAGWLLLVCLFISYTLKPTSNKALAHPRLCVIAVIVAGWHGQGRCKAEAYHSQHEKQKIAILKTVVHFW